MYSNKTKKNFANAAQQYATMLSSANAVSSANAAQLCTRCSALHTLLSSANTAQQYAKILSKTKRQV